MLIKILIEWSMWSDFCVKSRYSSRAILRSIQFAHVRVVLNETVSDQPKCSHDAMQMQHSEERIEICLRRNPVICVSI